MYLVWDASSETSKEATILKRTHRATDESESGEPKSKKRRGESSGSEDSSSEDRPELPCHSAPSVHARSRSPKNHHQKMSSP